MIDFNSTEHPITWFRDRYREGSLVIRPPFQRKPVWTARQKCSLIESILMRLPVPEIFVQHTTTSEGDTKYIIVDGQQRIRTVLQFIGAEQDTNELEYNKFTLDKLEAESQWCNLTFEELVDGSKTEFYGYRFAVRYLNTDNEEDVRDMFRRLNKYLTPLNGQELRNSTYRGPFVKLVERLADLDYWSIHHMFTPAQIRRMQDLQYMSELLIGVLHGSQGGSGKVIDSYYEQYEDYEDVFPDQVRTRKHFDLVLDSVQKFLPDIDDSRWNNRTDFYTLFVTLAGILRMGKILDERIPEVGRALHEFANAVDRRLGDENADVSADVKKYVRAVEKGANDKKRRADRQSVLTNVIGSFLQV
ncbi:MAG: DUF262 domain-containing protein [Planctomycetes bacterium]|nr:DUF262 domain-containing protein [Planctomycetota bacterium]